VVIAAPGTFANAPIPPSGLMVARSTLVSGGSFRVDAQAAPPMT